MWFSVVCTLINIIKMLWTHEAQLRVQTTLNHIRFVKFFSEQEQKKALRDTLA